MASGCDGQVADEVRENGGKDSAMSAGSSWSAGRAGASGREGQVEEVVSAMNREFEIPYYQGAAKERGKSGRPGKRIRMAADWRNQEGLSGCRRLR